MTKEVTKSIILQEIQDKFKLREFEPAPFLFEETVIPVYNIERHLQSWVTQYVTILITATGNHAFYMVPETERWELHRYDVVPMGAGAFTMAGVNIKRFPGTDTIYLDLSAAQTSAYHVELPKPVVINPKDVVYINIDGYTSSQSLRLYIDYVKEEIR